MIVAGLNFLIWYFLALSFEFSGFAGDRLVAVEEWGFPSFGAGSPNLKLGRRFYC